MLNKIKFLIILLIPLSIAHAQYENDSSIANPFGQVDKAKNKTPLTKSAALLLLSEQAKRKISSRLLDSLLNNDSNEVIVSFANTETKPLTNNSELNKQKEKYKLLKQKVTNSNNEGHLQITHDFDALPLAVLKIKSREALINLLNNPDVLGISEIVQLKPQATPEEMELALIKQPEVTALGKRGAGTSVVILDNGVDYTRPEFGNCAKSTSANKVSNTPNGICRVVHQHLGNDPSNLSPDYNVDTVVIGTYASALHGTGIAKNIAAVAPDAKIISIGSNDSNGVPNYFRIMDGINWAINNKNLYNIVAFNLSIGAGTSDVHCEQNFPPYAYDGYFLAFASARQVGILPVVAAGNNGSPTGVSYPACVTGATVVGAVDTNDQINPISNRGPLMDLFTPAVATSVAAPYVVAATAILRAPNAAPNDTLNQTVSRMTDTGKLIYDPVTDIFKPRLDLLAAVNSVNAAPSSFVDMTAPIFTQLLDDDF